jgi:hypothetical protein
VLTIRQTIQDTSKEPFSLLRDILGVFPFRVCSSSSLDLFVGEGKDVSSGLVTDRDVDVAGCPSDVSHGMVGTWGDIDDGLTLNNQEAENRKKPCQSLFLDGRETSRTSPHGLLMNEGIIPCFIPTHLARYLNSSALSAIRTASVNASAYTTSRYHRPSRSASIRTTGKMADRWLRLTVSNTPGPVSVWCPSISIPNVSAASYSSWK